MMSLEYMYYIPRVANDSTSHYLHPLEKSTRGDGEFGSTSDFITALPQEIPQGCTETIEVECDLRPSSTSGHLGNISSSVLSQSSHDSEVDLNKQRVDHAEELDSFPKSEKSFGTSGHHNDPVCENQSRSSCPLDRSQHKDKPSACHKIAKPLKTNQCLNKPLNIHSDETNFTCEICKMHFPVQSKLMRHTWRFHTVRKTHVCQHCGKIYKIKSYLDRHIKTHHSKTSFVCQICNKMFQSEKHLAEHAITHSDTKLHVYEGLKYGRTSSLETKGNAFHCQEKQDVENRTTGFEHLTHSSRYMNGNVGRETTSLGLTSTDGISLASQPSNYLEYDLSRIFNTESGIGMSAFEMAPLGPAPPVAVQTVASDFLEGSPVSGSWHASVPPPVRWEDADWTNGIPFISCLTPDMLPDYILTSLP